MEEQSRGQSALIGTGRGRWSGVWKLDGIEWKSRGDGVTE